MYSIIIPTLNNLKYLKICINSLKKNSKYNHEIIPHVNIGDDGTIDFLEKNLIKYTHTKFNAGICQGMNMAAKKATNDYILYAHDDFYFCPNWDEILKKEVEKIGHNFFICQVQWLITAKLNLIVVKQMKTLMKINFYKTIKNIIFMIFKDQLGRRILFTKRFGIKYELGKFIVKDFGSVVRNEVFKNFFLSNILFVLFT